MELALKIASKIRAKERFAVYIVIPMYPDGTRRIVTEEMLFWQVTFTILLPISIYIIFLLLIEPCMVVQNV